MSRSRILIAEDEGLIATDLSRCLSDMGYELNRDTLLLRRDGRVTPIDENTSPIRDDDGEITGAVLIFRDATGRRGHEAHSRQSQ